MSVSIDLADTDVWDDSALVKSWNNALQEYKKYHSIHAKGQKLTDVLTKEELSTLMENGLEVGKSENETLLESESQQQEQDQLEYGDAPMIESEEEDQDGQEVNIAAAVRNEPLNHETANLKTTQHTMQTPPQVLLNSVKDESVRNLMMSWYWAGYYTGLHEGQQIASTR